MRKIVYMLTLLAAMSCEYEIDIKRSADETGRIVLHSLAGLGDTTVVNVDAALPVGSSDVVDLGIHRQTAAAYLDQLVDEGLLSKEKVGRENIYKNVKLLALFENDSEVTV